MLVEAWFNSALVSCKRREYVMVTELPDMIEIRHTNVSWSFVRCKFVTCLLTYLF